MATNKSSNSKNTVYKPSSTKHMKAKGREITLATDKMYGRLVKAGDIHNEPERVDKANKGK